MLKLKKYFSSFTNIIISEFKIHKFNGFENIKKRINLFLKSGHISDVELAYLTRKNYDEIIEIIKELEKRGYVFRLDDGSSSSMSSKVVLKIDKVQVMEL